MSSSPRETPMSRVWLRRARQREWRPWVSGTRASGLSERISGTTVPGSSRRAEITSSTASCKGRVDGVLQAWLRSHPSREGHPCSWASGPLPGSYRVCPPAHCPSLPSMAAASCASPVLVGHLKDPAHWLSSPTVTSPDPLLRPDPAPAHQSSKFSPPTCLRSVAPSLGSSLPAGDSGVGGFRAYAPQSLGHGTPGAEAQFGKCPGVLGREAWCGAQEGSLRRRGTEVGLAGAPGAARHREESGGLGLLLRCRPPGGQRPGGGQALWEGLDE